jgi:hypothetical protein
MKNTGTTAVPHQTSTKVTTSILDLQEQIRLRAYELYEQRGRDGHELDNWLQAESEVTQQTAKTVVT